MKFRIIAILLTVASFAQLRAEVSLPDLFTDHMVLQRNQPVPIWGLAAPGESVQISFKGQVRSTTTTASGTWKLVLDPMPASSEPATLTIKGQNSISLEDILVGEVWLCAGQSNMQWRLDQSNGGDAAIAAADHPAIRLFNLSRQVAFGRAEGVLGKWQRCSPETVSDFSGVGYFFGLELYQRLGIPIGLINASYGGSPAEAWTPREYIAAAPELNPWIDREAVWERERPQVRIDFDKTIAEWRATAEAARAAGDPVPRRPRTPDALRDYYVTGSIYENMIQPLVPFSIKGVIWYQGEQNEQRAAQYELLLKTMIRSWRDNWEQGDFPFGIVQLPNFRAGADEPQDLAWSHLRDRQRRAANSTVNTGLTVTIDIGEGDDIHPPNKLDVGLRLAQWALADVYDFDQLPGGPIFRRAKFSKKRAILFFDDVGNGLQTTDGGPLREFAIAGQDGQWQWAEAEIRGRRKVIVHLDGLTDPQAVRYAFNNNPENPNLTNETGIPASPFRTDDWPGPTSER